MVTLSERGCPNEADPQIGARHHTFMVQQSVSLPHLGPRPLAPAMAISILPAGSHSNANRIMPMTDSPDRILRLKPFYRTGLSRSTLYRKMQNGAFLKNPDQ